MTNIKGIKETIHKTRKTMGITQKEMADKLNISQPAYSYYEKGNKPLPAGQLKKVLDILELDLQKLDLTAADPLEQINESLIRIGDILEKIYQKMS